MKLRRAHIFFLSLGMFLVAISGNAQGVVWTGPTITFSNAPYSDWTQPANQDRLTDQVWLTRSGSTVNTRGIFNALFESAYTQFTSPAGTEWAIGSLSNYNSLVYTDWADCYGGPGNLNSTITSTSAVLHLINEDIYLSVRFTFFGSSGGGFAYERSTPFAAPEPAVNLLLGGGTASLFLFRRKFRR